MTMNMEINQESQERRSKTAIKSTPPTKKGETTGILQYLQNSKKLYYFDRKTHFNIQIDHLSYLSYYYPNK